MSTPRTVVPLLREHGVECHTRKDWGSAREAAGSYAKRRSTHPMPSGPADCHFLHITVTADTDTVREGAAGARQVETYGLSTPPMVSYQDLVTNEGRYFQGQDYGTKGTHTINDKNVPGFPRDLNRYGYACAIMQNVGDSVTDAQVHTIAKVFAAREVLGLVKRGAPIYPHRKFAAKSCPGDKAVARLAEIARLRDRYRTEMETEAARSAALRTRRAWLAARRVVGRLRPKPFTFRFANLGSVSFGDARVERIWENTKNKPGRHGVPDLIGACEAFDLDLSDDDTHQIIQRGAPGSAESALVFAALKARVTITATRMMAGIAATREGGGIRRRPILRINTRIDAGTRYRWTRSFAITHAHPARAPRARERLLQLFKRTVASVKAGDLNIRRAWAKRLLTRRVFSNGVLHVEVPRWVPCEVSFIDIDSDHTAIDVTFWPTK